MTGMLCAGAEQFVDWAAAYRLFARERIERESLFAPIRKTVLERLAQDEPLTVMMDDTLIRKRGRKIFGTGWKRDPLGPHFCTNFVWGQRFLQISAALPDTENRDWARAVPVDFIHAPSASKPRKNAPQEEWQHYREQQNATKISTVASAHLLKLRQQVEDRRIICAVDGGFTNRSVFRDIPDNTALIGRIRKDAKLFALPEPESASRRGRRRWYGEALPTPEQVRQNDAIPWRQVEAFAAGSHHQFEVKIIPQARWGGTGEHTISIVIIRPLAYRPRKGAKLLYRNPGYLICTDPALPVDKILQAYLWRWEIELNFRDEKTVLGVGQAQVRNAASTQNVPALLVAAYAFLLLAGTSPDGKNSALPRPRWQKACPSERWTTQQMQGLLRSQLWNIAIDTNKPHFVKTNRETRSGVYSKSSLSAAVCYATK